MLKSSANLLPLINKFCHSSSLKSSAVFNGFTATKQHVAFNLSLFDVSVIRSTKLLQFHNFNFFFSKL